MPRDIGGLTEVVNSPEFATGVGLVRYGSEQGAFGVRPITSHTAERGVFRRVWTRLAEMF